MAEEKRESVARAVPWERRGGESHEPIEIPVATPEGFDKLVKRVSRPRDQH
jgi:hypothetical protein